jgi:hypothetical protein
MTKQMEKVFAVVSRLPAREQNAIARWLEAELASERRWQALYRRSQDRLAALADEALTAHRERRTNELDPDHL